MNFDEYIDDLRPTLAGYFILKKLFPKHSTITTPYPTSELTEEELEILKGRLDDDIPSKSMMIDIWDWGQHFERELSDDWYFEAVFGNQSSVNAVAEELAEFFLEKVEEYNIDYDQHGDAPEEFHAYVLEEARLFIMEWRKNIQKKIVQP